MNSFTGTWKAPSDSNDIKRLSDLLHEYEAVNFRQLEEIEQAKQATRDIATQIQSYEKEQKANLKRIKSLEAQAKVDRLAADGLRKRAGGFEAEAREYKHAKELLMFDVEQYKEKLQVCQVALNADRSKRLGLLHENELLRKQLRIKEEQTAAAEQNALTARNELLAKMQVVETLLAVNASQKKIIQSQSEEMILLANEVYNLKEGQMVQKDVILDKDIENTSFHSTIDSLKKEVYRLRKELNNLASTKAEKSIAFSNSGAAGATNRISTALMSNAAASRYLSQPPSRQEARSHSPGAVTILTEPPPSASTGSRSMQLIPASSWSAICFANGGGADEKKETHQQQPDGAEGGASTSSKNVLYFFNDSKNVFEPCDMTGAVLPVSKFEYCVCHHIRMLILLTVLSPK
jgi:hypothetical protein